MSKGFLRMASAALVRALRLELPVISTTGVCVARLWRAAESK